MRLIDADHLRKWILANWGSGWDSKTVDDILDQMDREDTYKVTASGEVRRLMRR